MSCQLDDTWIPDRVEVGDESFPYWYQVKVIDLATGEEIRRVVMCDQKAGIVERHQTDANDRPFVDPKTGGVALETLRGRFQIIWSEQARIDLDPAVVRRHLRIDPLEGTP